MAEMLLNITFLKFLKCTYSFFNILHIMYNFGGDFDTRATTNLITAINIYFGYITNGSSFPHPLTKEEEACLIERANKRRYRSKKYSYRKKSSSCGTCYKNIRQ